MGSEKPKVIVITGPSGVGKGTLIADLMDRTPGLELSISATTREPRKGERDGVDYHFLSEEDFAGRIADDRFLEHADYSGHRYGTLRSEVDRRLDAGHPVVLEIEVQGARQVRETMPEAVQVFIAPPGLSSLRHRLEGRGTDGAAAIDARMEVAATEMEAQDEFHHVVVNDDLEAAAERLNAIVSRELSESTQ